MLTQIVRHEGDILRVPRGETPIIELDIPAAAYVTDVRLSNRDPFYETERKTCDWNWSCFVVHPLGDTLDQALNKVSAARTFALEAA